MIKFFSLSLMLLSMLAGPAAAVDRAIFYGSWGTEQQCARELITPNGTVPFAPFEIEQHELVQGNQWCKLNWGPIEERGNTLFTGANAICGEDSVQGYFIGFELVDDNLTIRWNFPRANGPLMRCERATSHQN